MSKSEFKVLKVRLTESAYVKLKQRSVDLECVSVAELARKLIMGEGREGPAKGPHSESANGKDAGVGDAKGPSSALKVPDDAAEVRFLIGKKSYDTMVGWGIDVVSVCKAALKEEYSAEVGRRKK